MTQITDAFREEREWGLVISTARLERGRRAHESRAGLTIADNRLLWLLSSEGPRTMREISEALGLEQSTVNRQVNAAVTRGLVDRVERPGEAARAVSLTEAGAEHFTVELRRAMDLYAGALGVLPPEQRESFVSQFLLFSEAYRTGAEAALVEHGEHAPG